jgi:hypothetical protein
MQLWQLGSLALQCSIAELLAEQRKTTENMK